MLAANHCTILLVVLRHENALIWLSSHMPAAEGRIGVCLIQVLAAMF